MIVTASTATKTRDMARFRARLKQLALQKSVERGDTLTQRDLAQESGVSLATVSRLYTNAFDRIDADTVARLTAYFGCTLNDLIEIVPDEN